MARLVAVHFCPVEKNAALTTFSTAELKSASASTMVGFLPPISSWMRSRRLEASACSQSPISQEPVKRDRLERLGVHQRAAQFAARAGDEVDHALGNARLVQRLHDAPRAQRRGRGRLEHHGVAADQRRRQLPGRNGAGEIPRRDQPHHADRVCAWRTCGRGRARRAPACRACASLRRRSSGRC